MLEEKSPGIGTRPDVESGARPHASTPRSSRAASGTNQDMQMLLMNLKAHTPALTLLPTFEKSEIKADDTEIRAVLHAAYRLLKAMCTDFPLMQVSRRVDPPSSTTRRRTSSRTTSRRRGASTRASRTPTVCAQVTEDTVRQFVRLAAQEKAPRFLASSAITMPNDQVIRRARQIYESCHPPPLCHLFPYR